MKDGDYCPLLKKNCVTHKCAWYTHIMGMNPQTGQPTDSWGCAITVLPILLCEGANASRQTKAAVESARNVFVNVLPPEVQARIADSERPKLNGAG